MIQCNHLFATKNDYRELVIEKKDIYKLKKAAVLNWIHSTATKIPVANPHATLEERQQNLEAAGEIGSEETSLTAPAPAKKKRRKKTKR
jgi:hypothetical protein